MMRERERERERDVQIEYRVRGVFSHSKLIVKSCIIDNILFITLLYFLTNPTLSLQYAVSIFHHSRDAQLENKDKIMKS